MKLKLSWLLIATFVFNLSVFAQEEKKEEVKGYQFTEKINVPHASVKNQYRSGTCWSFSGIAFLEAELMRTQNKEYDLSEMFCVYHTYSDKAKKYIRLGGHLNFGSGAEFTDVFTVIEKYGLVPEEAYSGLNYGEDKHVHGELDEVTKAYVDAIVKNKNRKLTPVWHEGFDKVLDTYLGELPEKFSFEGKDYSPISFRDMTGLNMDDYVEFTSYSHHPFYEPFAIAIPDNWLWAAWMNVPMDDMMAIIDNALENGYTVAWGADVSDKGFSWKKGVAVIPDAEHPNLSGTEKEKWEKLTEREKKAAAYKFDGPVKEKTITQEMRQEKYDNYEVTDDHGMLIVGTAVDQDGNKYYKIKNSWGTDGHFYEGYFYASKAFVQLQTIGIAVNKEVIPKKIAKKCNIE
jgi:bleomycin hydrolase